MTCNSIGNHISCAINIIISTYKMCLIQRNGLDRTGDCSKQIVAIFTTFLRRNVKANLILRQWSFKKVGKFYWCKGNYKGMHMRTCPVVGHHPPFRSLSRFSVSRVNAFCKSSQSSLVNGSQFS
jgi:hypothetical protein